MFRTALFLFFLTQSVVSLAQIRFVKLELGKNEKYFIEGSLILVTDTLVMGDSSEIVLNPLKKENIINSRVTIIGKGCKISGLITPSKQSKNGNAGVDQSGPCLVGGNGGNGAPGAKGIHGNNLTLHLTNLTIEGTLTINLNGSNGGDGGDGGRGGSGGRGTKTCVGGNGGDGGIGGEGGHGGHGGTFSIQCKNCPSVRGLVNKSIIVKNYGGYAGLGGNGGVGGLASLEGKNNGAKGKNGLNGKDGVEGKRGAIKFLTN